ncbi:MAG TPA: DUF664 domain-containing protein [Micropruina sp.]|nr:DUF664 domain-containing protein [Propionibacterium sp.]HMQ37259.1 DUF664 domain-containing protein [Micropruina sp.]HMR21765.1 DUF664 domain-containing protein [Micropruina sp.]
MAFLTPNANGEAAVVGNFVRNQFAQVRSATHGLTDEAWHRRSTVSEFTLATLIDHVGEVAEQYGVGIEASVGGPAEYSEVLTQGEAAPVADRTGEQLLAEFDRRIAVFADLLDRVEAGAVPLDGLVPVPAAPWFPDDLTHWEVRWVLLHMATEVARHAGHADIIRESIDGKGSYELNALADGEQWPAWGDGEWTDSEWSAAGAE